MFNRILFTARNWPGFRPWFTSVFACIAVFEFLALLAWKDEGGSLFDITTAMVAVPSGIITLMVVIALLWALLAKTSFAGGLAWITRFLPVLWAIPVFDLIRSFGNGIIIGGPRLDGEGLLIAIGSAGLLPINSGYSIGIRFGIFGITVATGFICWFLVKSIAKAIITSLATSALLVKMTSVSSMLAIAHSGLWGTGWQAFPVEITRRAIIVLNKGYWWDSLYERFPTAINAQSEIATRLFGAGAIIASLGVILLIAFIFLQKNRKQILKDVFYKWGSLDIIIPVVIGIGFAWTERGAFGGITGSVAIMIFILLILSLRLANVFARCTARLKEDELSGTAQILTRGDMSPDQARDISTAGFVFSAATGWVLGWPVLLGVLAFIACSHLSRDRKWQAWFWLPVMFRIIGSASIALAGMYFMLQGGKIVEIVLPIVLAALMYRVVLEAIWLPKWRKIAIK